MANNVEAYNPIFYAQEALWQLESALGMAGRVHRGYDAERKSVNVGDTIQISKPASFTTTTGGTASLSDVNPTSISITVGTFRQVKFKLTDKELAKTSTSIIEDHISPAVYALAHYIEGTLTDLYKYCPNSYALQATPDVTDLTGTRKILRDNAGSLIDHDKKNVHWGVDSQLEADLMGMNIFHQAHIIGGDANPTLMSGNLGTRFGIEFFVQQTLDTAHTGGSITTGGATPATLDLAGAMSATAAKAATSIAVDSFTGTATFAAGDVLSIAGNSQKYTVTSAQALTGGAATLAIWPPLVAQADNNAVVTVEGSTTNYADEYYPSILFHRNAFAFAMAPLPHVGSGAGANMSVLTDPRTGLSIRSRIAYDDDTAGVKLTFDILYGIKCLDPQMAVIARRNA